MPVGVRVMAQGHRQPTALATLVAQSSPSPLANAVQPEALRLTPSLLLALDYFPVSGSTAVCGHTLTELATTGTPTVRTEQAM